ncbi:nuclear transport factor 2 family protein [Spirosoma sp. KNUC1025]|uniref:nuclear transport factor 2 family protein n=1 Tax=Spirosoma sp. KNUC1025 TaxID=2894082 RepID=UPI003869223B|nr:hypothetical protein LN737_29825 [Spirosoma sp. KNUC1025]
MDDKQLLEDSLLKVWSERNDEKRLDVMQQIYAPDILFYESDQGTAIKGHQAIDTLIRTLQAKWAPGFVFSLTKPAVINHGVSQVSWTLGAADAPPIASGMDIAIVANGLIKELYLYLDGPTD